MPSKKRTDPNWRSMSDEAVKSKTGRTWEQWFALLDKWRAADKGHKLAARHLADQYGLTSWWSHTVTVEFERARGLREIHETTKGFVASVSRTMAAPVGAVFRAFAEPESLKAWFTAHAKVDFREGGQYSTSDGATGVYKRIQPDRRILFTWSHPDHAEGSQVEVRFEPLGPDKCRVVLTHSQIANGSDRDGLKAHWVGSLDALRAWLERR